VRKFLVILKTLISSMHLDQVCLIRVGAKMCRAVPVALQELSLRSLRYSKIKCLKLWIVINIYFVLHFSYMECSPKCFTSIKTKSLRIAFQTISIKYSKITRL